jgi:hypothetical protein
LREAYLLNGKGAGIHIEGVAPGILAIVAGSLVRWGYLSIGLVIGIFLIVYGIIVIAERR